MGEAVIISKKNVSWISNKNWNATILFINFLHKDNQVPIAFFPCENWLHGPAMAL